MSKFKKDDYADIKVLSSDHPDLHVFQNQAKQDVIFTNFAYGGKDNRSKDLAREIPDNYQLFLLSDYVQDTDKHEYRCAAFIDYENKEIVFATAGTRPSQPKKLVHDFMDDVMLALDKQPLKTSRAAILNDMILDSLGNEAKNFTFHYTGHSLGAAMAEISAADMDIKMQQRGLRDKDREKGKQISAVSFETPGTLKILENMYKEANLPANENIKDLNLKEFNNRSNIINSSAEQAGQVYEIIPSDQTERKPNLLQRLASYLSKYAMDNSKTMLGRLVGKAFLILAPGGVSLNLHKEHDLDRFDDVFVQQKGLAREKDGPVITIDEALTGIQPLKYDEVVYNAVKDLKAKNNDIGKLEYSMSNPDAGLDQDSSQGKKISFSRTELESVVRQQETTASNLDNKFISAKPSNHRDIIQAREQQEDRIEKDKPSHKLATHREVLAKFKSREV